MKTRYVIVAGGALAALVGFGGYEVHVAAQQREQLATLRKRADQLATERAALRRERDAAARELTQAEQQLTALPVPQRDETGVTPERRAEINAWLARVKRLHELFDERPDQGIPEMRLLTDADWLRVAKRQRLESDEDIRKALAEIRGTAMGRFTSSMVSPALRKFAKAANADSTADISALVAYSDQPLDPTMLERYELHRAPANSGLSGVAWLIQNKTALDPDYETRQEIRASANGSYGSSSGSGPWAWVPGFREQLQGASKAYSEANKGGSATGIADVLPYFNPPLDPAVAAKLIKAERERSP